MLATPNGSNCILRVESCNPKPVGVFISCSNSLISITRLGRIRPELHSSNIPGPAVVVSHPFLLLLRNVETVFNSVKSCLQSPFPAPISESIQFTQGQQQGQKRVREPFLLTPGQERRASRCPATSPATYISNTAIINVIFELY